ncbi:MAG TPA: histidine kinase [Bryobacteraceae bacterium]|nr:histidine kinase [Bryobacteraceae bacterium]
MTETQRFLKAMIVSIINAREVESNRVSRLLHDEVGQVLTAVGLQLDVLKLDFRQEVPELVARVNEIQAVLDNAVKQVRALSYDLNPAVVERVGLQLALDRLVGRVRGEATSASIRLSFGPAVRVPLPVANAWYKIAELSLDNALQHSTATRIELIVKISGGVSSLEIKDNGNGFSLMEAKLTPAGLGLLLMEHYASHAPIDIDIKSAPGKGTVVRSTFRTEEIEKKNKEARD